MKTKKHPTPYAIFCHGDSVPEAGSCGIVYLQREGQHGYIWQMNKPDSGWYCPNCGSTATFQDDIYEETMVEHKLQYHKSSRIPRDMIIDHKRYMPCPGCYGK